MMRARRVRSIARFEFVSTVLKFSFLLTSVGLPLVLAAITAASAAVQAELIRAQATGPSVFGVVDLAHELPPEPLAPPLVLLATEAEGLRDLRRRRIDELLVIAPDWRATGTVRVVRREDTPLLNQDDGAALAEISSTLRTVVAADNVDSAELARILRPVALVRERLTNSGVQAEAGDAVMDSIAAVGVPMLLGILLMSALLMASGYLVQTIAHDKETKIVEVLLASATADEILAGKLCGLGCAGLLQFAIWAVFSGSGLAILAAGHPEVLARVPSDAMALTPGFFLLGYAFLGSLMLATGAFGSSAAESQKLVIGWVLLAVVPLLLLPLMLETPHGTLSRTLSFVPFSAPIAIIVRLAVDGPGVSRWDVAFSAASLIASTYVSLVVGARLFRVGLLLTGARPSVRAILAQVRSR